MTDLDVGKPGEKTAHLSPFPIFPMDLPAPRTHGNHLSVLNQPRNLIHNDHDPMVRIFLDGDCRKVKPPFFCPVTFSQLHPAPGLYNWIPLCHPKD